MAKVTGAEFADKWGRRLKGAVEDIKRGVEKVTEAPSIKAVAKQEKMLTKLTASIVDGTWARNLGKVSLEDWKKTMIEKGSVRISSGVDGAVGKVTAFAEKLLSYEDTLASKVKKMPDLTIEDSINRASEWIRGMSKFKK